MAEAKTIDTNTLCTWLETGQPVSILDIRPLAERMEWYIPGSIHINAYDKLKKNDTEALNGLHLDKAIPVVTFCAGGRMSLVAAKLLQAQGYNVFSLDAGMKGWSLAWNTAELAFDKFKIIQFRRTGKGCLSYMIISKNEAMVIDASLNIEAYEKYLLSEKAVLKYLAETHIHADHLSRSKQLAELHNAPFYLPIPNKAAFKHTALKDGDKIQLGKIIIEIISTPGHTAESTSYLIGNKILLTGDTLFINGVGRPDLKANNEEAIHKSKLLYNTLQKLLTLDENITVLPAHTSQPVDFDNKPIQTTIGSIRQNVAILQLNEEEFIKTIQQRIPPTPANYLAIVEKNIKGDFSDINPVDLEAGANRCAIS
ncbi:MULTISPECIES: MBL fold metallo-hydrolase [unclassified Paraflavitalea]|uniref:MBL fold metallo-hydrolase n=1 Tax=unclassified Paraflavitalea TaxID=2798305 RepID=UPI003D34FFEC